MSECGTISIHCLLFFKIVCLNYIFHQVLNTFYLDSSKSKISGLIFILIFSNVNKFSGSKIFELISNQMDKRSILFFTQYLCGTPFCVTQMQNASVELWLLSWVRIRTEFGPVSFEVGTGTRTKSATLLRNNYVQ